MPYTTRIILTRYGSETEIVSMDAHQDSGSTGELGIVILSSVALCWVSLWLLRVVAVSSVALL